jgi:hypothetical protein
MEALGVLITEEGIVLERFREQHMGFPHVDHTGNVLVAISNRFNAKMLRSGFLTVARLIIICVRKISLAFMYKFRIQYINGSSVCETTEGTCGFCE